MREPLLINDGDSFEKQTWNALQNYFPEYEIFWKMHIVPLRAKGSILLRDGLDEDFERLAMYHYSAYANLARADQKIENKLEELCFFDEIYANLQRSCELAAKVVRTFSSIYKRCVCKAPKVNDSPLEVLNDRLRKYRNLIHGPLSAYVKEKSGRLRIPKPEHLEKYWRWSQVLYHNKSGDFEDVETQLKNDFRALCSALQQVWREMCIASRSLAGNPEYTKLCQTGSEPQLLSFAAPGASAAAFPISSNAADNKPKP